MDDRTLTTEIPQTARRERAERAERAGSPLAALAPATLTILRVAAGLLFMQHGLMKLFGLLGARAAVPLFSQMGLAGVLETFGGALLVLGLFTRPVAFVLAIEMLVAFTKAHLPRGGFPIQNGGELPLLYAAIWLCLLGHGAGPFSLDALLRRRRDRPRRG